MTSGDDKYQSSVAISGLAFTVLSYLCSAAKSTTPATPRTTGHGSEDSNSGNSQQQQPSSSSSSLNVRSSSRPAWALGVTLTFQNESEKALFITQFRKLAAYVAKSEPDTLSYELMESDKINTQVFILERYVDRNKAYLSVHRTSQPFLEFKSFISSLTIVVDGHSYYESGIGFI